MIPSWSPPAAIRATVALHGLALSGAAVAPALWPWMAGAVVANHAGLTVAGLWPRSRLLGPNLIRLPPAAAAWGLVALTFDDGPDPAATPRILDLLERHDAGASFFCIGERARLHPGLMREIVARGHSVENHTHRHPLGFAAFGLGAMRREVMTAQAVLADMTGVAPTLFRSPAGLRSPLLDPALAGTGLRYATWTRRGHDSMRRDPAGVLRRLHRGLGGGDILLLHDGTCARTDTGEPVVLAVLPRLLAAIAAAGLRAVPLPTALALAAEPSGQPLPPAWKLLLAPRSSSTGSGPGRT